MSTTYISPLISKSHDYASCGLCWCLLAVTHFTTCERERRANGFTITVMDGDDFSSSYFCSVSIGTGTYIHASPEFNDRQTWWVFIFAIRRYNEYRNRFSIIPNVLVVLVCPKVCNFILRVNSR